MSNSGVFNIDDINFLRDNQQYPSLGQLELIETQKASSVVALDFTDIKEDIYNVHLLTTSGIKHASTSTTRLQFFESGVLETGNVYHYGFIQGQSNGSFYDTLRDNNFSSIYVTYSNNGTNTGDVESCYMYLYNLGNSAKYSMVTMLSIFQDDGVFKLQYGSGLLPQKSVVDGIRLNFQSASTNGFASLYGIRFT